MKLSLSSLLLVLQTSEKKKKDVTSMPFALRISRPDTMGSTPHNRQRPQKLVSEGSWRQEKQRDGAEQNEREVNFFHLPFGSVMNWYC